LRGDHHKWIVQGIGGVVHRDLFFIHGFEKGALRSRRGTINLIGQYDIGEQRSLLKVKPFFFLIVNGDPGNVSG
jgi:hypothetical protein